MKPSRLPEARRRQAEGAFFIDPQELTKLYKDLRKMDPRLALELRRGIREAGELVKRKVVKNAAAVSTDTGRITSAVRIATTFRGKHAAASITVSSKRAPEGRPLESLGFYRMFRHPHFGNREIWYSQKSQPFFFKSVDPQAIAYSQFRVAVAIDRAARAAGFTR